LGCGDSGGWSVGERGGCVRLDAGRENWSELRERRRGLSLRQSTAAVVIAATGGAERGFGFRAGRFVTLVGLADAAGMRGRSRGRQRDRKEVSGERE